MVEAAHAGFYLVNITLQTLREQTDPHPEAWWMETWAFSHTWSRLHKYTHRRTQSYLCPLNRAAHTAAVTRVKSQPCCLSTGSGGTLSKWTHVHLQTLIQVCVLCIVSGYGLTDGKSSSFSIAQLILSPAYHLVCSTDVCGVDVPPVRFM